MAHAEIIVDTTDGFVDFTLPVLSAQVSENGEADLLLGGMLDGRFAELSIHVVSGLLPSDLLAEDAVVHCLPNGLQLRAEGSSGEHFLRSLAGRYGSVLPARLGNFELTFTTVALEGDPARLSREEIKFKLFHETGSPDDEEGEMYFEMFCNVDIPNQRVEIREKDIDFRAGVIAALSSDSAFAKETGRAQP